MWLGNLSATRHYLYAVHLSEGFLFSPTLAAALYLLLLRLLARQYDAVATMASLCVCDGPLSLEERQIVMLLAQANGDRHPDAHACRLHVSLHAMHTPLAAHLPWDLARELRAYVHKRSHVSLSCRLEVSQELLLLTRVGTAADGTADVASPSVPHSLRNRRLLLEAARTRSSDGSSGGDVTISCRAPRPRRAQFDACSTAHAWTRACSPTSAPSSAACRRSRTPVRRR